MALGYSPTAYCEDSPAATHWTLGVPIVTYWAGPPLTDPIAEQMAAAGFNLAWCHTEEQMDTAARHGLRGLLQHELLSPKSLDEPARRSRLDDLIDRIRKHPALYAYYLIDEPSAEKFAELGLMVAYLRQRDPAHLAYINLFPTYASKQQLGADTYTEYLRRYIEVVRPGLISYDHYQFAVHGDTGQYFLNLGLVRRMALEAGLPFLNIVQASSWDASMRVPTGDELRYLVFTSLAYGAQGISYYVYCWPNHAGGIVNADGTPTPLYNALKSINPQFTAIAAQLQPLRSLAAYHVGMTPPGAIPLPDDSPFGFEPPLVQTTYEKNQPVKGLLLGLFGPAEKPPTGKPTHFMVVNLDYHAEVKTTFVAPDRSNLDVFDPTTLQWTTAGHSRAALILPPGGGQLLRVAP